jgi:hypothetical protein
MCSLISEAPFNGGSIPEARTTWAYLSPVLKTSFLDAYLKGQRLKGMDYGQPLCVFPSCLRTALLRSRLANSPPLELMVSSNTWLGSKGLGDVFSARLRQPGRRL